jgi:hypothetical protein
MYMKYSSPLFNVSLQTCTSYTLSPRFYASLHRAVLHVHCHLLFMFHYTELYFMYHEVQLCVVKHKKEVTMYMKYSCV